MARRESSSSASARLGEFAAGAQPPAETRSRAVTAIVDTVGVALAGAIEPAARAAQAIVSPSNDGCRIFGTDLRTSAADAAFANGTAAHALDYDDMCFVSLAHPSAPLVPAILAMAELTGASGPAMLDAYVVGFEIQARLGRAMNPRHYARGWHCTSTLGTMSAAAASARLLGLEATTATHALGIAASMASGLKENFGSMVKPLHAGLAARNGVQAALLARAGATAGAGAVDGPQGLLAAMDSERLSLDDQLADFGQRWESLDTGITIKLYPSCAGTHPTLDAVLDLRREFQLQPDDVEAIVVDVDRVTPTILLYDRPATGLEGKFSMPFCVAAALVYGRVGIDTFEPSALHDPRVEALLPRVTMRVDPAFDTGGPALTRARVHLRRRSGETIARDANGARGYPEHPASGAELADKFLACAERVLSATDARTLLDALRGLDSAGNVAVSRLTAAG